jgi:phospholipid transport system substrate-binding protein
MIHPLRSAAMMVAAFFAVLGAPVFGQASGQEAESFIETNAQQVISTLQALDAGEAQLESVREDFRDRVQTLADLERITNFVLGRYRRTADEETLTAFRETFREYAFSVYEGELTNYAGQTLEVTGSVTRRPGDYIVESRVTGGPDGQDYEVNWRVLASGEDGLKVVDVQVMGIWLAQTQREQILSVIGNHRGDVSAATELLRSKLAEGDLPGAEDLAEAG